MTTPSPNDTYTSPLAARNASPEMLRLWSPRHKFNTWRRIWLAIAEAQHEVTKDWERPLVTAAQVAELKAVVDRGITDEELTRASELERELRHDVMAHVHCLGEQCPTAKPIIHLGCTSQDVVCNGDLLILSEAGRLVDQKSTRVIGALSDFASRTKAIPTLGFTHYQSAQPVTVGRRCIGWAYELWRVANGAEVGDEGHFLRGFRGATGTQASFLSLLGDGPTVDRFEQIAMCLLRFGREQFEQLRHRDHLGTNAFELTGQTYPRVLDAGILADLASTAAVLHKIATDIRLLCNRKELDEPFEKNQIGSSAMPYKRNPMRCERICGLTRFVMNLVGNAYETAATQWLERTLDDSSNRRLSLPEAFLALDGALDIMHNVASGLVVHEAMVKKNLMAELPFLATENILMEAVKAGGDRQELHEVIRKHAQEVAWAIKQEGKDNGLIDRLRADPAFAAIKDRLTESDLLDPMNYIGRSVEQTDKFVKGVIDPIREQYSDDLDKLEAGELRV